MKPLRTICMAAAFVSAVTNAAAIEPERREVIVTHNRVWDGDAYHENFVPSDHDEMLLLSGQDNAVAFVRTQEYYWPLARQVYVAFDTQREEIGGVLRISRDGEIIQDVEAAPYVVVYPEGAVNGNATLVWGQDAVQAFVDYQQAEREFVRAFTQSQRAHSAYNDALLQAGRARLAGEGVQNVEAPPPHPEPSLRLVTEPRVGFRVALAAGAYELVVVQDGAIVDGTVKALRVIEADAREGLVAEVIPEERWTRPIPSNTAADRIYVTPGTQFFATLAHASNFDEAEYVGLTKPQGAAVNGRTIWVKRRPAEHDVMQVNWGEAAGAESLARSALKVEQTQGAEFGYVVRTAIQGEKSDLQAFSITVPDGAEARRGFIEVPGSDLLREIVVVQPRNAALTWMLAVVPFLFGLTLYTRRRIAAFRI